jgi:hypothetical protein
MAKIILSLSLVLVAACAQTSPQSWDDYAPADTSSGNEQRVVGVATRIMAIGAESTGLAVEDAQGELTEIDFMSPSMASVFVEGWTLELYGRFESVRGVEIPSRQVFFVTKARRL